MRKVWVLLLITAILGAGIGPSWGASAQEEMLDQWMEKTMEAYGIPGMALAVTRGDQIIYIKGTGQGEAGRTFNINSQIRLGSVSQTLTALAVMQLVEEGAISLDDPVQQYISYFRVRDPEIGEEITLGDLLYHQSGLGDKLYPETLDPDRSISAGVVDLRYAGSLDEPGKEFHFFDPNYNVLAMVIEEVSGLSFDAYMQQKILGPLLMRSTLTGPLGDSHRMVQGHGSFFTRPFVREGDYRRYGVPSSYMISTVSDLSRFLLFLLDSGTGTYASILSSESKDQLWEPVSGRRQDFAAGWFVDGEEEATRIRRHAGNTENHHVQLLLVPEEQLGIAILTNVNHVIHKNLVYPFLGHQVREILQEEKEPGFPWVGYMHRGIFFLAIVLVLRQLYRMRKIPGYVAGFKYIGKGKLYLSMLRDASVPLIVLVVLPRMIGFALQQDLTYGDYFREAPDLFLVLLVLGVLPLFRIFLKLGLLADRPRNPYRVNR